jgi:hypothetical protein
VHTKAGLGFSVKTAINAAAGRKDAGAKLYLPHQVKSVYPVLSFSARTPASVYPAPTASGQRWGISQTCQIYSMDYGRILTWHQ